jgi:predicted RNA-binding Zn ribbon-like protein
MTLTPLPEVRDGFKFRSGHPSLDLVATVAGRLKGRPRDLLATPEYLDRWLKAAGLDPAEEASGEDLRGARSLREAIYRLALARARGAVLAPEDVDLLNRWAAEPGPVPRLEDGRVRWTGGVRTQVAALARGAIELLGGELRDRIRECGGEGCAILFVDASRGGERRWCSMSACGNKAKVAEFRRRRRGSLRP